jgi:GT2 family glycosyltransferase
VEENQWRFWNLPTGEDMDFGIRARKNGWKFYFLPSASVDHMHRADLPTLLRVWHSYGAAHPPLLKAHARSYMEIVFQFLGKYPNNPILRIPFFIKGFIYLGSFHLMHLFGLLFVLFFILQWIFSYLWLKISIWAALVLCLFFMFRFFRSVFIIEPYNKWFEFAKMKYLTNLYFIFGGLKGSFHNGTLCIEPSF